MSSPLDFRLRSRAHGFVIEVSIGTKGYVSEFPVLRALVASYTTKYESGCLLNSFELMRGPSTFGLGLGGDQLACDAAFGLNPLSVGPTKLYFEGWSLVMLVGISQNTP